MHFYSLWVYQCFNDKPWNTDKKTHCHNFGFLIPLLYLPEKTIAIISVFWYHCYVYQKKPLLKFRFFDTTAMSAKKKYHCQNFGFLIPLLCLPKKTIAKILIFGYHCYVCQKNHCCNFDFYDTTAMSAKKNPLP